MPKVARKAKGASTGAMKDMGGEEAIHSLVARNLPLLSRSMTFAKMVGANLKAIPNLRELRWLFPPLCERRDQAALSDTEKSRVPSQCRRCGGQIDQRMPLSQAIEPFCTLHISGWTPNELVHTQPPMQAQVGVP